MPTLDRLFSDLREEALAGPTDMAFVARTNDLVALDARITDARRHVLARLLMAGLTAFGVIAACVAAAMLTHLPANAAMILALILCGWMAFTDWTVRVDRLF